MKRSERTSSGLAAGLLVGLTLVIGGCASAPQGGKEAAAAPKSGAVAVAAPVKSEAAVVVAGPAKAAAGYKYVCSCGPTCDCETTSNKPGTCTCGKPLTYKKIIREDSSYFWVCPGASDEMSKDDLFKCADGKPLQAIMKKGRYVCSCGEACDCGYSSQRMGTCSCGKPLKAVQ